jgi:hypothetical protein
MKGMKMIISAANRLTLVLIAATNALLVIAGCGSHRAVVPTSYDTYNVKSGAFKIEYPGGWKAEGGGQSGFGWATFTSGNAKISVGTSLAGSLIGGLAGAGIHVMGTEDDPHLAPVARVHQSERKEFEEEGGVKEQDPVVVQTKMGEGRKSEFAGKTTFGSPIHGYRATVLSINHRIRVVCQCPQAEWETLKPAFDICIESVGEGRPN